MQTPLSHLRYTLRSLVRAPGFTITTILILSLGIGANTAIFSLVNGVLLRPLPYPQADRLVQLSQPDAAGSDNFFDYPNFIDYSTSQHSCDALAVYDTDEVNLTDGKASETIGALYVSNSFFQVMGRRPTVGQIIGEGGVKSDQVAVLGKAYWKRHFQANPDVVGTNISVNGNTYEIIGVTPEQANEANAADIYLPLTQDAFFGPNQTDRSFQFLTCVGRLKPGVTLKQAQSEFEVINRNLVARYPDIIKGTGIRLTPYLNSVVSDYSTILWTLAAAVGFLLLIACANVANLLLVRTQERQREMSIRAALGAGRGRIVMQVFTEILVLALVSAIIGSFLAWTLSDALKSLTPAYAARFQQVQIDATALLFTLGLTALTALIAGLLPVWIATNSNLAPSLKEDGSRSGTAGPKKQRGQTFLIAAQVALTSLLLIGAGLLSRSYQALQNHSLGFRPDHVLVVDMSLRDHKYQDAGTCRTFLTTVLKRTQQLPGVSNAALSDNLPFWPFGLGTLPFFIDGQPTQSALEAPTYIKQIASTEYFQTLGIPLLRGRLFDERDQANTQKVAVINQSLAKRFFPSKDPIGQQIHELSSGTENDPYTIIGVVGDTLHTSPQSQLTHFHAYFAYTQGPHGTSPLFGQNLLVRTNGDPLSLATALRKVLSSLDPNLPPPGIRTFDKMIGDHYQTHRLAAMIVGLFSGASLLLAAIGLYAVLSYAVTQRTREIGIRITLGALSSNILEMIIRRGLAIVSVGLIIGTAAAFVLGHLLESTLYGISSHDPIAILLSLLMLSLAGFMACFIPALRASRISPIKAMRE